MLRLLFDIALGLFLLFVIAFLVALLLLLIVKTIEMIKQGGPKNGN